MTLQQFRDMEQSDAVKATLVGGVVLSFLGVFAKGAVVMFLSAILAQYISVLEPLGYWASTLAFFLTGLLTTSVRRIG